MTKLKKVNSELRIASDLVELELLKREAARRKFEAFIDYTFIGYKKGWVHKLLCAKLQQFYEDVLNRESPRLLITMPPRHGKSELVSRRFPSWVLGRNPNIRFISCSYGSDLATSLCRDVQNIMSTQEYQVLFKTRLGEKAAHSGLQALRTSDMFEVVGAKGTFRATGVGGGITGRGCDILNIDDPHKDRQEASSPTIRERVHGWYASTAYTRLEPGAGVLLTQTRWHVDDLAGRLLKQSLDSTGDKWEVINFPAIAEYSDEHREVGEALHPARYDLEALHKIKRAVGERDFSALYQQHPINDASAVFKERWLNYYDEAPTCCDEIIQSWDMSFKDKDTSDYVSGQVWGRRGGLYYLIYFVHDRMDFVTSVKEVARVSKLYPKAYTKLIEDKANGCAVINYLKNKISGIIEVEPQGGKGSRAYSVTPFFEAGNVWLPSSSICPQINDFINELLNFPVHPHDDNVDALSQALIYFQNGADLWSNII